MSLGSMSGLSWIPEITYSDCDVPITVTFSIPQRNWGYGARTLGGFDRAASGVGQAFVLRHDRVRSIMLRFTEDEWMASVEPMMKILLSQDQAFTLQLDKDDASTANTVRLVSPVAGDDIQITASEFPAVLELTLQVMTSDGSAWTTDPYFPSLS